MRLYNYLDEGVSIPSPVKKSQEWLTNPTKEEIGQTHGTDAVLNWVADASNKNVHMWNENTGDFDVMWNKIRHTSGDTTRSLYHKDILMGKYEIATKKVKVMPSGRRTLQGDMNGVTSFGWADDWFNMGLGSIGSSWGL